MRSADTRWDWNVAVFCRNERRSIARCVESIAVARSGQRVLITVIDNGSTDDSAAEALSAARRCQIALAVYKIPHGDKSNAMNCFFFSLREPSRYYFFVDAYVTIGPGAMIAMETCLATRPEIDAVTAVAVNGRTMASHTQSTLNEGGRLHGQLHALRPDFIDRVVTRTLRVPVGLYRGDGLLASMVMHALDPVARPEWDPGKIGRDPAAAFIIPELSIYRWHDIKRQFSRKVRQMRGQIENLAIRAIVYQHGYEGLPTFADTMLSDYLRKMGRPKVPIASRVFQYLAIRQVRNAKLPSPRALEPVLVERTG